MIYIYTANIRWLINTDSCKNTTYITLYTTNSMEHYGACFESLSAVVFKLQPNSTYIINGEIIPKNFNELVLVIAQLSAHDICCGDFH